jgi:predicted nucleic acid-binding Zn ribbon protein
MKEIQVDNIDFSQVNYQKKSCLWCGNEFIPSDREDFCTEECADSYCIEE